MLHFIPVPERALCKGLFQTGFAQGGIHGQKKGKSKFRCDGKILMQSYNIPQKKILTSWFPDGSTGKFIFSPLTAPKNRRLSANGGRRQIGTSFDASDKVLKLSNARGEGSLAEDTGAFRFGGKKTSLYYLRLSKIGKIARISRGIYISIPTGFNYKRHQNISWKRLPLKGSLKDDMHESTDPNNPISDRMKTYAVILCKIC
jgi:hypothetical protein